jgi:hypothetical protein
MYRPIVGTRIRPVLRFGDYFRTVIALEPIARRANGASGRNLSSLARCAIVISKRKTRDRKPSNVV